MECIDLHLTKTLFSFLWVLVSLWWTALVFIINKKQSVVLHLTLHGFLLLKILPALNLFLCILSEKFIFLFVFGKICEVLIEIVYFVSSFGIFYFSCIGLGFLKVEEMMTRFKMVFLVFFFSYGTGALLYFYRELGDFLAFFYYQATYICILDSFFQASSLIKDSENIEKKKQVKILNSCKNLVFFLCYFKSMFHLVMFLNSYFKWGFTSSEEFLDFFALLIETRLLYTSRPRKKSYFCYDFLFPQEKAKKIPLFKASLSPSNIPITGGNCLVLLQTSTEDLLNFGIEPSI
jgi:hypothetical protein